MTALAVKQSSLGFSPESVGVWASSLLKKPHAKRAKAAKESFHRRLRVLRVLCVKPLQVIQQAAKAQATFADSFPSSLGNAMWAKFHFGVERGGEAQLRGNGRSQEGTRWNRTFGGENFLEPAVTVANVAMRQVPDR